MLASFSFTSSGMSTQTNSRIVSSPMKYVALEQISLFIYSTKQVIMADEVTEKQEKKTLYQRDLDEWFEDK